MCFFVLVILRECQMLFWRGCLEVGAVRLLVSSDNGILIKNCSEKLIQKAIIKINSMNKDLILDMKYSSVNKIKKSFLWNDVIKKMFVSIQKNI